MVEIIESESVNSLELKIKTQEAQILIPFLQVIGGGMQDRMVTKPMLIQPKKDNNSPEVFKFPVNCVEQGRWQYYRQSTGAETTQELKAHKKVRMSPSMGSINYGAKQQRTWSSVDHYSSIMNVNNIKYASKSYLEVEEEVQNNHKSSSKITPKMKEFLERKINCMDDQMGLAFFIGNRLVAIELYGSSELWNAQAEAVKNSLLSEIGLHEQIEALPEKTNLKNLLLEQISNIELIEDSQQSYGHLKLSSSDKKYATLILEHENSLVELYHAPKNMDLEGNLGSE